jgi:putative PIN family toxin of toxin-antitoxin system
MRVVLDTNILISALLANSGTPGRIYRAWVDGHFELLTCRMQLEELRLTFRKPTLAARIRPYRAGRLVNELKELATFVDPLPHVKLSPDPGDDFLLAASEAGMADFLVTGDKSGLLGLRRHKATRILTARGFVDAHLRSL